jgi:hypothetical protein
MWSKFGYADTWNCLYIKHNYVYRVSKKIELKGKVMQRLEHLFAGQLMFHCGWKLKQERSKCACHRYANKGK